jgi:hypothetical protein
MRFPKNQLKENQYTSGGEFINPTTNSVYSGFYWEDNGRYFIGKILDFNATEIKKITSGAIKRLNVFNSLPSSVHGVLSNNAITFLANSTSTPAGIPPNSNKGEIRYFIKQTNSTPILIREVNQDTFKQIRSNPIYQTIAIKRENIYVGSNELDTAEAIFPGIKGFLSKEI